MIFVDSNIPMYLVGGAHPKKAEAHVLLGRQVSRWWDIVGGVRQAVEPGPAQTWVAVGIQGLAPYWFEIAATGYVGASGRTQARAEVEYDVLLTNRLVLQPRLEVNAFGKSDPERGIGNRRSLGWVFEEANHCRCQCRGIARGHGHCRMGREIADVTDGTAGDGNANRASLEHGDAIAFVA